MTPTQNSLETVTLSALAILSFMVALGSWRFMVMGLEEAFRGAPFDVFLSNNRLIFLAHIVASPIALAIGALQFFTRFLNASLVRHRFIGRVYGLAILVGGISAILMTLHMWDRPLAAIGFFWLGVFWIGTTGYAVALARWGNIRAHRDWMIRSFALTASALTLRLYLALYVTLGYDYHEVSHVLAWACWVPNLIFAEWLISRNLTRQRIAPMAG